MNDTVYLIDTASSQGTVFKVTRRPCAGEPVRRLNSRGQRVLIDEELIDFSIKFYSPFSVSTPTSYGNDNFNAVEMRSRSFSTASNSDDLERRRLGVAMIESGLKLIMSNEDPQFIEEFCDSYTKEIVNNVTNFGTAEFPGPENYVNSPLVQDPLTARPAPRRQEPPPSVFQYSTFVLTEEDSESSYEDDPEF